MNENLQLIEAIRCAHSQFMLQSSATRMWLGMAACLWAATGPWFKCLTLLIYKTMNTVKENGFRSMYLGIEQVSLLLVWVPHKCSNLKVSLTIQLILLIISKVISVLMEISGKISHPLAKPWLFPPFIWANAFPPFKWKLSSDPISFHQSVS